MYKKIHAEYSSDDLRNVRISLEENGTVINKTVSFESFKAGLLACEEREEVLFRPERMSESCVDGIYNVLSPLSGTVAFFLKGQQQLVFYGGDKDGGLVPFPSLVFFFSLTEGRIISSRVFAVKSATKEKLTDATPLYNYPYGNVSPYNGRICWGSNALGKVKSFKELEKHIRLFFSAPTNNDLYRAQESVKLNISLPNLMQRVKELNEFDTSILKDAKTTFIQQLSCKN